MTSDSLAAEHVDDGFVGQDGRAASAVGGCGWGACVAVAIATVMMSAPANNARSRLGDMLGIHAVIGSLLASFNFSPGPFTPANWKKEFQDDRA